MHQTREKNTHYVKKNKIQILFILQTYSHPGIASREILWSLKRIPELRSYIHIAVTDEKELKVYVNAIESFEEHVLSQIHHLTPGQSYKYICIYIS